MSVVQTQKLFDQQELKKDVFVIPFSFNAIELCVVTINEKPWTRAKEVCRALEYNGKTANVIKAHVSPENYAHKWQLTELVSSSMNWPIDSQKIDLYINEEWIIELLVSSQQPLAKELAEYMGIKIIGHKYVRKEAGTIYTIQKVFEGMSIKRQFIIGSYRIDLYFPEHKLPIESGHHNHKDRDISYEIRKQKFIEDQLNCKFIPYFLKQIASLFPITQMQKIL